MESNRDQSQSRRATNKLNHVRMSSGRRLRRSPSLSKSDRIAIRGVGRWNASQGEDGGQFLLRRDEEEGETDYSAAVRRRALEESGA
jgi:hypothetical protein